jgi:hypothetical protein
VLQAAKKCVDYAFEDLIVLQATEKSVDCASGRKKRVDYAFEDLIVLQAAEKSVGCASGR